MQILSQGSLGPFPSHFSLVADRGCIVQRIDIVEPCDRSSRRLRQQAAGELQFISFHIVRWLFAGCVAASGPRVQIGFAGL
jgi:hypothetical protein